MELITMHSHTTFCGHAKDSLEDMVAAAHAAGISAMAITEHYPLDPAFDPTDGLCSMLPEKLDAYKDAVRVIRAQYPDMELLLGCELDWLGNAETRNLTADDFADFDIVLGSVHFMDDWLFNSSAFQDGWETHDIDEVWRRYIDLWCDAAVSDRPFTVMAHPDVLKKFGQLPSFDLTDSYERMAEAAAAGNRLIEVNTSALRYPYSEFCPAPALLEAFCRAGVGCTVGTDAHNAGVVAADITKAYAYMYEAGYREVSAVTRGRGVRTFSIDL